VIRLDAQPMPAVLASPRAEATRERAQEFFGKPATARAQERFRFDFRFLGPRRRSRRRSGS